MRAWFLNLGPSSTTRAEAHADIRAMASTKPDLIMGAEALAKHPLPDLPGYQRIVSRTNEGRINLWAYALGGASHVRWIDCRVKFPRAEHPQLGLHPARSILRFNYHGIQVHDAHKPPLWKGAGPAREEHDRILVDSILKKTHEHPRLLLWDCNGMEGAHDLAKRVDGRLVGDKIDNAVVKGLRVRESEYRQGVRGHQFATDHPWGAFYIRFTVN